MNKVLLLSGHDIDVLQDANIEADIRDANSARTVRLF